MEKKMKKYNNFKKHQLQNFQKVLVIVPENFQKTAQREPIVYKRDGSSHTMSH